MKKTILLVMVVLAAASGFSQSKVELDFTKLSTGANVIGKSGGTTLYAEVAKDKSITLYAVDSLGKNRATINGASEVLTQAKPVKSGDGPVVLKGNKICTEYKCSKHCTTPSGAFSWCCEYTLTVVPCTTPQ